MRLYSWNVNGIRAVINKNAWQPFIKAHQPDILCLQETKAQPEQIELSLEGYNIYINSADKKGYSGTAIISKTEALSVVPNIPAEFVENSGLVADDFGDANKEGRLLMAEFSDFYVVTCYTPNAKDKLARIDLRQNWDRAVTAYCADLQTTKPVIYCGDMNVAFTADDLARPAENEGKKGYSEPERTGFANWLKADFIDSFRLFTSGNGHYSWWTAWGGARARNVGWRIDYCLVSDSLKKRVVRADIHADVLGSDHCPVSLELKT